MGILGGAELDDYINSGEQIAKVVNTYIKWHEENVLAKQDEGEAYYKTNNLGIMRRRMEYYSPVKAGLQEDPYKANNKLAGSFAKLLVDQKLGYSINEKMSIVSNQLDAINLSLGEKSFKKAMRKVAKDAANKFYGVLHFYIKDGVLDYLIIPSQQIIRIPNAVDDEYTDAVIRYYVKSYVDNSGKTIQVKVAEYWDNQLVYNYVKTDEDEEYKFCNPYVLEAIGKGIENPAPHFKQSVRIGRTIESTTGNGFGVPPFAILINNDELQRDIDPVLPLMKVWDIVISDFANNLEDFQEVFWILKNYQGQDVEEFFDQVKRLKVIKTGEDGSAETKQVEIPTEARMKMLEMLERLIYKFGRGVDTSQLTGNVTNVQIMSMYSGLDLKANEFEMQLQEFFEQCLSVLNGFTGSKSAKVDIETSELKFKRSQLLNKSETITTLMSQVGFISKKTLLELHPDINDVDEELKRIKDDSDLMSDDLGGELGFGKDDGVV